MDGGARVRLLAPGLEKLGQDAKPEAIKGALQAVLQVDGDPPAYAKWLDVMITIMRLKIWLFKPIRGQSTLGPAPQGWPAYRASTGTRGDPPHCPHPLSSRFRHSQLSLCAWSQASQAKNLHKTQKFCWITRFTLGKII